MFDAGGFQQNHSYFSQQPFEHIDPLTGSLILRFTDLVLPGDAGRDLKFVRTYNSKGSPDGLTGAWMFGLDGMVMRVADIWPPPPTEFLNGPSTLLVGADGGQHNVLYKSLGDARWVVTDQFWLYDRQLHTLYLPDGTISHFDATTGSLSDTTDPFNNVVTLTWQGNLLTVEQHVGASTRQVKVYGGYTPSAIVFQGRTWSYHWNGTILLGVTPPIGPGWQYDQTAAGGNEITVTTPQGGWIRYNSQVNTIIFGDPNDPNSIVVQTKVITQRIVGGREISGQPTWTYTYPQGNSPVYSEIVAPDGTRTRFFWNQVTTWPTGFYLPNRPQAAFGGYGYGHRTVLDATGTPVEDETREYTALPLAPGSSGQTWAIPQLTKRVIDRHNAGHTYETDYIYDTTNLITYADYHNPMKIVETGELSRETDFTYVHLSTPPPANGAPPFMLGLKTKECITVGGDCSTGTGDTFSHSWGYNTATGFRTSETAYGVQTTYTPDSFGNIGTATRNGHTTSITYTWGVPSQIQTPMYTITRTVNPDGTIALETRGGRTTSVWYDELSRPIYTQPPGNTNGVTTTYDNVGGASVSVERDLSIVTTTVDGLGRPTLARNSVGVETRIHYDAMGRKSFEGYAQASSQNDLGTILSFDALGRVAGRQNPDGSTVTFTYGGGTVTITEQITPLKSRQTIQGRSAFGNPNETRLVKVIDAKANTWNYSYNALGKLTQVDGPDNISRIWRYNQGTTELQYETQPESGTTTYNLYWDSGNLRRKTDANQTVYDYVYDNNERVAQITATPSGGGTPRITTITYESGTDNRSGVSVGTVSTGFTYDSATGRLKTRTDSIDARSYTQSFDYDGDDNLTLLTYAAASTQPRRQVQYQYDGENRIIQVTDLTQGVDIAYDFQYHPSGAVTSFTSGNGVVNRFGYDQSRYWVRSISATGNNGQSLMSMNYDIYDFVGNVLLITDPRFGNQSFVYDDLDRLTQAANGSYGTVVYNYDAHGNRTGTPYDYDLSTLRLQRAYTTTFCYNRNGSMTATFSSATNCDTNGNPISGATGTFTYTPDNQMATSTTQGATSSYSYDGDGWRAKVIAGGTTSYFLRGPNGQLLTESRNPGGTSMSTRDYIYAGTRLLSVVTTDGSAP